MINRNWSIVSATVVVVVISGKLTAAFLNLSFLDTIKVGQIAVKL